MQIAITVTITIIMNVEMSIYLEDKQSIGISIHASIRVEAVVNDQASQSVIASG